MRVEETVERGRDVGSGEEREGEEVGDDEGDDEDDDKDYSLGDNESYRETSLKSNTVHVPSHPKC